MTINLTCKQCKNAFNVPYKKRKQKFCSISCSTTLNNKNRDYSYFKGEQNPSKRPEVRKKISKSMKGRIITWSTNHKVSEETKRKLSDSHKIDGRTTYRKEYIRQFDNPVCDTCKSINNVDIHHIESVPRQYGKRGGTALGGNHSMNNLLPLCRSCHRKEHNK